MNEVHTPTPPNSPSSKNEELFLLHRQGDKMRNFQLAMAYVPWQPFGNLYDPDLGLSRGTLFSDLDFPLLREEVTPRG